MYHFSIEPNYNGKIWWLVYEKDWPIWKKADFEKLSIPVDDWQQKTSNLSKPIGLG